MNLNFKSHIFSVTGIVFVLLVASLFVASFFWGVYTIKNKIFPYHILKALSEKAGAGVEKAKSSYDLDKLWADKISKGGYIIHFRHAQREMWRDVTAFDAIESITKISAENSSFARATCLTAQGIEEAKLIGKAFSINNVKIDKVISSPSCRARQTAKFAFGKIDMIDTSLLHRTAMMREQHEFFGKQLREIILNNNPTNSKNTILSGHGGTLEIDKNLVIDTDQTHSLKREETGFVVIENVNGKLYARHTFSSIANFVNASIMLK